jgi:hypothetical protein
MKYTSTRFIAGFMFSIVEIWIMFYIASRGIEVWVEMAMLWQLILTSIILIIWAIRGRSEYDRRKDNGE